MVEETFIDVNDPVTGMSGRKVSACGFYKVGDEITAKFPRNKVRTFRVIGFREPSPPYGGSGYTIVEEIETAGIDNA